MSTRTKVVIAGGSGYLGRFVAAHFARQGHEVVILSRRAGAPVAGARMVEWDGRTLGEWARELNGAAVVINLAGRSVNCRYNARNREEILASRLDSTRVLAQAIAGCDPPPAVWLNSSSATLYRHAEDRPMDEATGEIGKGFSVEVVQQWERAFFEAQTPGTRKVALRTAMVFGPGDDGVLGAFLGIVRKGLGGTLGSGRQYVSWIHIDDFLRSLDWLIQHPEIDGAVNVAAPNPLTNREMMRNLREACGQRIGLPATAWMLEVGAVVLGTETELLLKSRRVVPTRLLESGFNFRYPTLSGAVQQILAVERAGA